MPSPAVYRSPRAAAIAAVTLLSAAGAATLFRIVADVRLYGVAGDLSNDAVLVDDATLVDADSLYQTATTIHMLVLIVSGIVFVNWFYRVRVNAETFDPHGHRFRRGWSIWAWITPVVALWFPRQIAGDIWQAGSRPDAQGVRPPLSQGLLNAWWLTFWASNAIGRIGTQYNNAARYPDDYQQSVAWLAVSDVLEVVAAVLAVLVVLNLTATQEQRFAESAAAVYGAPAHGVHVPPAQG